MIVDLMTKRGIEHELLVIGVSYAFIFAGAWNDGVLGLPPSHLSRSAEIIMAIVLFIEVCLRVRFTPRGGIGFWSLAALDMASVLTIFPLFTWITFARVVRMVYAAGRLTRLLDRMAAERNNGMYITGIFPFVVPLLAAAVFVIDHNVKGSGIHTYLDALRVCFSFSLSLGNVRPASGAAMAICGALFLLGLLTIGVLTNTISARYQRP